MSENRVSRLRTIAFRPPEVYLRNLLTAACVLAAIFAGCAPQAETGARGTVSPASSAVENSAAAGPRFSQGGPDADFHGMGSRLIGDRVGIAVAAGGNVYALLRVGGGHRDPLQEVLTADSFYGT